MPPTIPSDVRSLLEEQHHLITTSQVSDLGHHPSVLARLRDADVVPRIDGRVHGIAGVPMTWERRMLATVLAAGGGARASHRAVARLLGVPTYEGAPIELSVLSKRKFARPGVIVHESRDLAYVPPIHIDGIPCTPPRRLAVDIGAVLGETAYTTVIRELRRSHGVSWKQLAAILELHSRRGRNGCGPLRRQLERYHGIDGIPDTTLEQVFLDDLIDAGHPPPTCQHVVPQPHDEPFRLDFAWVPARLDVEIDGPHHRTDAARRRDARRDAVLRRLGWKVLRFDEEEVMYAPGGVLYAVRRT
ncbi:MAG TPA: hypothetical protein DCS55_12105, partial [Acidimicrobiaceae bacterium]|nr:hypothetical protein [Acidimicrobiaceae bacterium]